MWSIRRGDDDGRAEGRAVARRQLGEVPRALADGLERAGPLDHRVVQLGGVAVDREVDVGEAGGERLLRPSAALELDAVGVDGDGRVAELAPLAAKLGELRVNGGLAAGEGERRAALLARAHHRLADLLVRGVPPRIVEDVEHAAERAVRVA